MASVESQEEGNQEKEQAKVWKLIYGFAESTTLRCAAELGIAGIIHGNGGSISLSELACRIPAKPVNADHLGRIMRFLVHMELFSMEGGGDGGEPRYGIRPPAMFLVEGREECLLPSVLRITGEGFTAPWRFLKENLEEGPATGKGLCDYLAGEPAKSQVFNGAMACDTGLLVAAFTRSCGDVLEGVGALVDVGGCTGAALSAVARAFPLVKCTVYDLPHVIAGAPRAEGVSFVAGDMFQSVPAADAIMLKCILHNRKDEDCIMILKRCKEAISHVGSAGKVIIIDIVLDAERDGHFNRTKKCMDLDMMINTGRKERTEGEWKKLIYDAGFASYKIRNIAALQSVILAYPF